RTVSSAAAGRAVAHEATRTVSTKRREQARVHKPEIGRTPSGLAMELLRQARPRAVSVLGSIDEQYGLFETTREQETPLQRTWRLPPPFPPRGCSTVVEPSQLLEKKRPPPADWLYQTVMPIVSAELVVLPGSDLSVI